MSTPGTDAAYLTALGDDALVYAQRLGDWVSRAPHVEEDMALANVGLDLIGQARRLYTRVGELDGTGRTEDDLAMLRDERDFRNVHLVEQPKGDFAQEMARLLWFSRYQRALYARLVASRDVVLAGIAGKAVKEAAYHVAHASAWVVRLGDGTAESHERMAAALHWVAPYVDELFTDDEVSVTAADGGLGVLPSSLRGEVEHGVAGVLAEATLAAADPPRWRAGGGRSGVHSESMGYLLATMQHIARSHPGATW